MTGCGSSNQLSETDIDDAELFEEDEFRFLNGMIGIAYQQNIGLHTFEENEEQRYIKFVRLESSAPFLGQLLALRVIQSMGQYGLLRISDLTALS